MTALTAHAADRISDRLMGVGLDPAKVADKADSIAKATSPYWRSVAVLMATFDRPMGDDDPDLMNRASNGDCLWLVCRDGRAITLFFRRSTQPATTDAFHVDKVLRVKP